ncbi:MAG: hypothetical protein WC814_00995 [Candidatus Paceibacterota bacterium]|jgi:hypothetical protein
MRSSGDNKLYIDGALIVAILSLLFSFYTHTKLTVLNKAEVVISPSEIQIETFKTKSADIAADNIVPSLTNIGKATADNIRLEFFGCYRDFYIKNRHCLKYWDTQYISELPPGATSQFGATLINYPIPTADIGSEQFLLLFHVQYLDTLTNSQKEGFYFFHYLLGVPTTQQGKSAVGYLVSDDLGQICPGIVFELTQENASLSLINKAREYCVDVGNPISNKDWAYSNPYTYVVPEWFKYLR